MFSHKTQRIFLLFIFPFLLIAQTAKNKLTDLSYDELHDLYFTNTDNPKTQLSYTNAYMTKAIREKSSIRIAKANYQIALLYYKSDKNKAIRYLDSVIKYSAKSNDKFFPTAAYCEKGDLLKSQFKFKEALSNYNMAEKTALRTNIDYYYVARESIAITKSEDLEEYNEALDIYKECYKYYKSKSIRNPIYAEYFQSILFGIADCFKSLKNTDSTSYYNKLGYLESKATKNEEWKYLFVLNEGANQVLKKNYGAAIDSIKKALPKIIKYKDTGNELAAYYYLGHAYKGQGNKLKAAENFIRVDSIQKLTKEITTEFIDGYPFLITYYENLGDKENQLKFITAYMSIDSTIQRNYRELNKLVNKEYDTPHLISNKERIIASLNSDKIKTYWGLGGSILLTFILGVFAISQYNTKKRYRLRFEKIIKETPVIANQQFVKEKDIKNESKKIDDIGIAKELTDQILEKLNHFEKSRGYLESNLTVQMISTTFETNSKYVSKVVNVYKEKSFIQYINDLRIDYAINQLQKNNKLRKYTIQALALEFGFNNAESFSIAFYKKTGIKPTYFIKRLDI